MIQHYIIGIGAVLILSTAWVGVQRAWRRSFPEAGEDPDALAGRSGCYGCRGPANCKRKRGACQAEEEAS